MKLFHGSACISNLSYSHTLKPPAACGVQETAVKSNGNRCSQQGVRLLCKLPEAVPACQVQLHRVSSSHLRTVAEQSSSSKTASTAAAILDLRAPLRWPLPAVAPRLSVLSGSSAVRLPVDRHCRSMLAKSDSMPPAAGACASPPCSKRFLLGWLPAQSSGTLCRLEAGMMPTEDKRPAPEGFNPLDAAGWSSSGPSACSLERPRAECVH